MYERFLTHTMQKDNANLPDHVAKFIWYFICNLINIFVQQMESIDFEISFLFPS